MAVPTSWQALDNNALTHNDPIIKAVLDAINNMLIELMAAMAREDYETRREHQCQGIETAKANGRYKDKQTQNGTRK